MLSDKTTGAQGQMRVDFLNRENLGQFWPIKIDEILCHYVNGSKLQQLPITVLNFVSWQLADGSLTLRMNEERKSKTIRKKYVKINKRSKQKSPAMLTGYVCSTPQ